MLKIGIKSLFDRFSPKIQILIENQKWENSFDAKFD